MEATCEYESMEDESRYLATLPERARALAAEVRTMPPLEGRQQLRELVTRVEVSDDDSPPVVYLVPMEWSA